MAGVPDHLEKGLSIVFIGFNPSPLSAESGHHYANPRNHFWRILHEAGLTPRLYDPSEDGQLLKLGIGFTNIVARPTRGVEDITREEYRIGRELLREKLERFHPRVACFVGKGVYAEYSRNRSAGWGFQQEPVIAGMQEFVAPSSSGLVRMSMPAIVAIYRQLADFLAGEC
ncbi:mismatch-specific DNA-glycosylase [Gorillibacterium timonense]|uniref:mismatch-specific DNA-glycosylase n=1 Tax=Gorillibacterium timonense TaxID=1689269 RepID=UPI00071C23CF|nr:mismatch-specific DNA-glycosylase [Gorillibacterium timonense]